MKWAIVTSLHCYNCFRLILSCSLSYCKIFIVHIILLLVKFLLLKLIFCFLLQKLRGAGGKLQKTFSATEIFKFSLKQNDTVYSKKGTYSLEQNWKAIGAILFTEPWVPTTLFLSPWGSNILSPLKRCK